MAKDNAPPRIVLFFDTHEAFWGEHRSEAKANYFFRDEWLRCLLRKLNYDAGIVAVVAGRDQPRWAEAKAVKPNTDIPSHYLDNHRVGNLSAADALAYLQQPAVGIADEALCQSLIAYASVEVGEVHPLHLGLCADVALRAQVQGTPLAVGEFCAVPEFADKSKLLVERLLKYVNSNLRDAIYALSACRTFDFELFNQLGEALKFSPYRADFDTITQFSFVKRLPLPGDDCYRIHGLLQRLFYIDSNYWVANAHIFLEAYYWGKNEFAEAIYHANRQNISRSIDRWGELFEESLKINQLDCCRKLLSIKNYLFISNEFQLGNILSYEAHYYKKIAFYQESAQTYKDSLLYFDRYLERFPSDINALNNKANTLQRQGGLYELKSQNYQACLCYQKSLQLYEIILDVDKASLRALNNKGACLRSLGSVQHELGEIDKAILAYQESLDNLEVRLSIDPNYVDAIHNKGTTYQFLGKLHMKMGDYVKARSSFDLAIENFEKALSIDPVFVFSLLNQANTLDDIATLMMLLSRHEDAIQFSEKALYTYEVALSKTPYDHYLLNNKAASLFTKARAQKKLSMYEQSLNSYLKVINICDEALNYTPKSNFLLNWRGKSYIALGVIRSLLDGKISTEFFLAGISSLSYSLMLTPENLEVKKLIQETQAILLLDGSASTFSERKPNIEG